MQLKNEVSYHPQRVSLEECSDGYHLHYRNYKLLLSPDNFKLMQKVFKEAETNTHYAQTQDEIIQLFSLIELPLLCKNKAAMKF